MNYSFESTTQLLKIIIVGDSGVGKTSLLKRFCLEKFDFNTMSTSNCDFLTKSIKNSNDEIVNLHLWDIAG